MSSPLLGEERRGGDLAELFDEVAHAARKPTRSPGARERLSRVAEPALVQPRVHPSARERARRAFPPRPAGRRRRRSTRSACSAVESRCAIVITVRPADSRRSASVMRRSVAGSTALVASSRISKPGLVDLRARERDQLALADRQRLAPLAHRRVQALGERRRPSRPGPSSSNAVSTSRSLAPARPYRTFSRTVVSNRNPSCGTMRMAARRDAGATLAQVDAVDLDVARRRIGQPREQLRERRLARRPSRRRSRRARRARTSTEMPRSTGPPSRYEYSHARSFEPRARPTGSSTPSSGSTISIGQVEHREDLPPAGDRGLRLGVDLRQVGEHVQEDVRQEEERGHADRT